MNVTTIDGFEYSLSSSFVSISPVLQMLQTHLTMYKDLTELPVTLQTLLHAVRFYDLCYAKGHKNDIPKHPIQDTTVFFSELVSNQEYEFVNSLDIKKDVKNLFEFADYIDFGMLRRLMAKTIAFKIKQCKHVEDIRKYFGFINDFDPEEFAIVEEESKCLH
jgi:hypothetical protein